MQGTIFHKYQHRCRSFDFRYLEANSLIGVVGNYELENDLHKAQDFVAFLDLNGDGKVDAGEFTEALSIMVGST